MSESKPKTKPFAVQSAAALLIAHGIFMVLDANSAGRAIGDMSDLPKAVIWLGVMIFLAGLIFDLQVIAWWLTTMFGGLAGIFLLLRTVGYVMYRSAGLADEAVHFSPTFNALAGVCLLLASLLLTLPDSKRAFGLTPPVKQDDFNNLP